MSQSRRSPALVAALCAAVGLAIASAGVADSTATHAAGQPHDVYDNFGFPLTFDASKMDLGADPRQDFRRYAAGKWLDKATLPADLGNLDAVNLVIKQVDRQVATLLVDAAAASAKAKKGTPLQQVGDLYAAGMDVARLRALGAKPLQPTWDRIAKIDGRKALAEELAQLNFLTGHPVFVDISVATDIRNPTRYVVQATDPVLMLPAREDYLAADMAAVRAAQLKTIADSLVMAGVPAPQAQARAAKVLAIETRIARKKLTEEQALDFNAAYSTRPYAEIRSALANLDLDAYFKALGLPTGVDLLVTEIEALKERNAVLGDYPLADIKDYLQWETLRLMSPHLSPAFVDARAPLTRALTGTSEAPKRETLVADAVARGVGHSLGRLYVERYFSAQSRAAAEAVVSNVRAEFRQRLEQNTWLTAQTKRNALQKFDRIKIVVGYPEKWIDYSTVDVRRDDYFGSATRLNEFAMRRALARLGTPPAPDAFSDPENSLPTKVNAGYSPDRNGIEIPAAILQPPFYDPKADPAVNYCSIGAVIGHELTHSLDWMGRLFDANGALRDWWTPADVAAFDARSKNLVAQGHAYEVVPGTFLNGSLSAGENLADLGGVMLGYRALQTHLKANPQDDRKVDGFTPQQRCFLAWAQLWASKTRPELLRTYAATDPHPPGSYRMIAPARNHPGFYDAFGFRPGDKMWIEPKDRVEMW
jgi:predicted metalloendopeptidase